MVKPGDVVTVDFPGVLGIKRRPAAVISSDVYHLNRPDVVLGLLTTQSKAATGPTDYALQDWAIAGLHHPSVFRVFFSYAARNKRFFIGHLSDRDWLEVQGRLHTALAI